MKTNLILILILVHAFLPLSAFAKSDVTPDVLAILQKEYSACSYTDEAGNPLAAQIYKIPSVNCGAVSVAAKPPKGICDDYVSCAAPGRPDVSFHVRCFSLDGVTCPSARDCRDAIGLESYDASSSSGNRLMLDQKGTKNGTVK